MTSGARKRIQSILERTLAVSASKRSAFLDEVCGNDKKLRRELESLLADSVPTQVLEDCAVPTSARLEPGGTVGSYRVLEEIGRGGMGVVYKVLHLGLDREFALKTLKLSSTTRLAFEAFQREAKILGALKHPNIVDVTDFGTDAGQPYLVMELVHGSTLRERCLTTPLDPDLAVRVLEKLAQAIDYAHSRGVLHGDLKPENVILGSIAEHNCKVLDFGVARLVLREPDAPRPEDPLKADTKVQGVTDGLLAGTPAYMAPELFSGARPSNRSDLYALAVVAFEILVGHRPFAVTEEAFSGKWKRPPPPRPSDLNRLLPVEVDGPLMAALSAVPGERPSSASAFTDAIRQALEQGRIRAIRRRRTPKRCLASLALAGIMSLASVPLWHLQWTRQLEGRLLDARWALLPPTSASREILLVTVDDRWISSESRSLGEQGDVFGERLQSVFSAGAAAIALDIVLPAAWSNSQEFSRLVLTHADRLTLAAFGSADGTIRGQECIHPLTASLLGPAQFQGLFGLVNLKRDGDGAVRKGQWAFLDKEGRSHLTWASRSAMTVHQGLQPRDEFFLDQSILIRDGPRISFLDIPEKLHSSPEFFQDKLVIVGATYEGASDTFPGYGGAGERESVPGVLVQMNLVQTLLSGVAIEAFPEFPLLVICTVLFIILSAALLLPLSTSFSFAATLALLLSFAGATVVAFRWFHVAVPMAGPMASLVFTIVVAVLLRRLLP